MGSDQKRSHAGFYVFPPGFAHHEAQRQNLILCPVSTSLNSDDDLTNPLYPHQMIQHPSHKHSDICDFLMPLPFLFLEVLAFFSWKSLRVQDCDSQVTSSLKLSRRKLPQDCQGVCRLVPCDSTDGYHFVYMVSFPSKTSISPKAETACPQLSKAQHLWVLCEEFYEMMTQMFSKCFPPALLFLFFSKIYFIVLLCCSQSQLIASSWNNEYKLTNK